MALHLVVEFHKAKTKNGTEVMFEEITTENISTIDGNYQRINKNVRLWK